MIFNKNIFLSCLLGYLHLIATLIVVILLSNQYKEIYNLGSKSHLYEIIIQ